MKFPFIATFLVFLPWCYLLQPLDYQDPTLVAYQKAKPEDFPYNAYVQSDLICLGCLVTKRHVVVPGVCIRSEKNATVYLGAKYNPYYEIDFSKNGGIQVESTSLYTQYLPDKSNRRSKVTLAMGLIEFVVPVELSAIIRPAKLPEYKNPGKPGTVANVTGYLEFPMDSIELKYMTVKVPPKKQCKEFFPELAQTEGSEICVIREGLSLDLVGPLVAQNVLIGLGMPRTNEDVKCSVSGSECSPRDVFLGVKSYIAWLKNHIKNENETEVESSTSKDIILDEEPAEDSEYLDYLDKGSEKKIKTTRLLK